MVICRTILLLAGAALFAEACGGIEDPHGAKGSAETWLADHPRIAAALVFDAGDGNGPKAYSAWSAADRAALEASVDQARSGTAPALMDPPLNVVASKLPATSPAVTAISTADARGLYFGYVGRSLMLEMTASLPWSIAQYDSTDLAVLLDSRSFFRWESNVANTALAGYAIYDDTAIANAVKDPARADGWVIPAPPNGTLKFLVDNSIIGSDRLTTIVRLIEWERANMAHFGGDFTMDNNVFYWQYTGAPPVSRIVSGTTTRAGDFRHWTAGCPGTTTFMQAVLRAVNIPVRYEVFEQHALPYFATEQKALSHGDDPYNAAWSPSTPRLDASALLLDKGTYDSWFSASLTPEARLNNVGRRTVELGVSNLSNSYLLNRCHDIAQNITSHAASTVYRNVSRVYSVAELEAMGFWEKLDSKISALGGCDKIKLS